MLKDYNFSNKIYYLPAVIFFLFFISEFTSKALKFSGFDFTRVSGLLKLVFEIFILFYIYKYKKRNFIFFIKISLTLLLIYFIGHFFTLPKFTLSVFFINLYSLNGYLFIFILFLALNPQNSSDEDTLKGQVKYLDLVLKIIFIINSTAIVLGLIFSISLFQTYLFTNGRFGYNGMLLHASHSSYIYCIYIIYFYNKYLKIEKKKYLWFLVIAILMGLIISTKTVLLFIFLFLIYVMYKNLSLKLLIKVFFLIVLIVNFTWKFLVDLFKDKHDVLYNLYKNEGVITMLFSTRNQSIYKKLTPYITEKWTWLNFIFGGANFNIGRTEFEIIDLFWFFGVFGGSLYIYFLYQNFIKVLINNSQLRIPILFLGLCISLSGSFFTNTPVIPYFIVLFFYIKSKSICPVI